MTKTKSEEFLGILNEQDERCQFTAEYETIVEDKSHLNYLEVTTINNKKGQYDFKVYRKDAITTLLVLNSARTNFCAPLVRTSVLNIAHIN